MPTLQSCIGVSTALLSAKSDPDFQIHTMIFKMCARVAQNCRNLEATVHLWCFYTPDLSNCLTNVTESTLVDLHNLLKLTWVKLSNVSMDATSSILSTKVNWPKTNTFMITANGALHRKIVCSAHPSSLFLLLTCLRIQKSH